MTITYRQHSTISIHDLLELYSDAGWTNYTKSPAQLQQAIVNSLLVYTAWQDKKLVGLIRAVGDGHTILYIQDILVHKQYKRKNIGTTLLQKVLDKYPHVRQNVLLTDESPETRGFYQANGFQASEQHKLTAFVRFND